MPFINIVFQNVRRNYTNIFAPSPAMVTLDYNYYTNQFLDSINLLMTHTGNLEPVPASPELKNNCGGIFFCESSIYQKFQEHTDWRQILPERSIPYLTSLTPVSKKISSFLNCSTWPVQTTEAMDNGWTNYNKNDQILKVKGTEGRLHGSDRYSLLFEAKKNYPAPINTPIKGLFVHIKNKDASQGAQIASICRCYPDYIIFGDMNIDLLTRHKFDALTALIEGTHAILAIKEGGEFFPTH
ncbi:MAG: hypothetical protein JKY54_02510, partial [Flavobacteriales bacterium]|nr:hypothetical protein [Flavobacteriales bacterium]